ncbi:MAG: RnfABCDGE type electron transport complex subunit D [Oscillospiraceae bacterium]|jgi:electron transport complex protein RnfD|nr:RnfABCDGE type electron transport complex subunit D [Oscillospiraceae bacterium]
MEDKLSVGEQQALAVVSTSPHIRTARTTRGIMLDVCLALLPALGAAAWRFGTRALAVTAVSVASCVGFEALMRVIMKKRQTVGDLSAVVTGLLLAFNLPATLPLWMVPIGALAAVVVAKELFGGLGQNFANPAITGRIVLMLSFTTQMTSWNAASGHSWGADAVATATPLKLMAGAGGEALPGLADMFLGRHGGSLGETCALALLLGFAYLCVFKVIAPVIPLCFVGTVAVFSLFAGRFDLTFAAYQALSGGLLLGAVFMATDYATSPVGVKGKVVFGIGCGLVTCLIRFYGNMPEGVSFAILLMNLLVPLIERACAPKPFGKEKRARGKKQEA